MKSRLLNSNQIRDLTGLSRSTLWREERAGRFPPRVRITSSRVGWDENEVLVWLDGKLKSRSTVPSKRDS